MDRMFYLLNLTVSGIKCVKDEVRLEFYKKTVSKDFNPEKYRVKAIYGENGSGKTALITSIKIFQDIILNDHYLSETKTQKFLDEIINKSSRTFQFTAEYLIELEKEKIVYLYSLEIGKGNNGLYEIKHEILKTKSGNYVNNKFKTVFESENGELTYIDCQGEVKKQIEKMTINLLSKNSFIYLYITKCLREELNRKKLLLPIAVCLGFALNLRVYLADEDQHELYFIRKTLQEASKSNEQLVNSLYDAMENDFSSVNEKIIPKENFDDYKENVEQLTRFIKVFKKGLISIDIDAKEDGDFYRCDLNLNYGEYIVNSEFESTGIKKLIRLFDCFVTESNGGIVFIDEMDSNLNDVYLCKLIEYFMYYGKGQLCFTTHNLDPMSVLKENRNSIDFLSSDNRLVSWVSRGNATPENCYRNGLIEDFPFNIEASDFVGMFGE